MKFFSRRNSKNVMKWPCSPGQPQYVKRVVRCMSCISTRRCRQRGHAMAVANGLRSEEHTSELQSPDHLVCRLLLEKKKNPTRTRRGESYPHAPCARPCWPSAQALHAYPEE